MKFVRQIGVTVLLLCCMSFLVGFGWGEKRPSKNDIITALDIFFEDKVLTPVTFSGIKIIKADTSVKNRAKLEILFRVSQNETLVKRLMTLPLNQTKGSICNVWRQIIEKDEERTGKAYVISTYIKPNWTHEFKSIELEFPTSSERGVILPIQKISFIDDPLNPDFVGRKTNFLATFRSIKKLSNALNKKRDLLKKQISKSKDDYNSVQKKHNDIKNQYNTAINEINRILDEERNKSRIEIKEWIRNSSAKLDADTQSCLTTKKKVVSEIQQEYRLTVKQTKDIHQQKVSTLKNKKKEIFILKRQKKISNEEANKLQADLVAVKAKLGKEKSDILQVVKDTYNQNLEKQKKEFSSCSHEAQVSSGLKDRQEKARELYQRAEDVVANRKKNAENLKTQEETLRKNVEVSFAKFKMLEAQEKNLEQVFNNVEMLSSK